MFVLKILLSIVIVKCVTGNVHVNVAKDLLELEERFNKKFEQYENKIQHLESIVEDQASLLASCFHVDTKTSSSLTQTTSIGNSSNSTDGLKRIMPKRRELTRKVFLLYLSSAS